VSDDLARETFCPSSSDDLLFVFFFSLPLLSKMELRAEQYESALLTLKEAVKEPDRAKRIMLKKKVGRDGD
jgi:hypothetical protein